MPVRAFIVLDGAIVLMIVAIICVSLNAREGIYCFGFLKISLSAFTSCLVLMPVRAFIVLDFDKYFL